MRVRRSTVRQRLFSLMEIMVVLIIIGLVLGLVGPAILEKLESAKMKTAKSQILMLEGCVTSYYLDLGEYPDSMQGLSSSPGSAKWKGPYVAKGVVPKDPWGMEYQYSVGS